MSRRQDVWKNMDVHKAHIEFLSEEEAFCLFKKKVGNYVDFDDQLRDIAWSICKECQGLPVAINAIGAALKGKSMHAWKDALHKLETFMLKDICEIDPKAYASLKWSYDGLESEDAKSCFLLCCLFAEDAEISVDNLVRYYMAWRTLHCYQMLDTLEQALDRVCTVVDTLKSCCLLLDGKRKHLVKMHDVVRDVAISIAEDEKSFFVKNGFKDWPEKAAYEHCSVISLRPDDVPKFPDELVCPELHTLRLDCTINRSPLQIPDKFFNRMENLMVLDLNRVTMFPLLPTSLAKLAKLQMLCLNHCNLGDIATVKNLKDHLEIFSLRGSNIKVLPPEVGELTLLRLLDMTDCDALGMIPKGVISKLFRLEELYMPMSFRKWEGIIDEREIRSVSLNELISLTQLTTLHIWIPDAALLPMDLTFANLVRFRIIVGGKLHDDVDKYLKPVNSDYAGTSAGFLRLENFHVANASEFLVGKLTCSIPRNGLCPSIFTCHMTDLSIRDCRLKYLFSPPCARGLVQLRRLEIQHCRVMEGMIGTEGDEGDKDEDIPIIFSGLKLLYLENLSKLISFYPKKEKTAKSSGSTSDHAQMVLFNHKVQFPRLENLELDGLQNMDNIWGSEYPTDSLSELKCLKAKRCVKLKTIFRPSMARVFVNLQELIINDCSKIEAVVDGEEEAENGQRRKTDETFPHFSKLELRRLPELRRVCHFTHPLKLPLLSQMVIEVCPRLISFSSGSVSTPNLFPRHVSCDFDGEDTTVTPQEIKSIGGGSQEPNKMV